MNKDRLFWAISGLLTGYFSVLLIEIYQWAIVGVQGIPTLDISYLTFSSMRGIGVILSLYLASVSTRKKIKSALWVLATFLFFMQLNHNGRGYLLATLLASVFLIYLRYKIQKNTLLSIVASVTIMVVFFANSNGNLHESPVQAQSDIELSKRGKNDNSLGYRLAVRDVGLYGIAQKPSFGHGASVPESYFEKMVVTYKDGRYKGLPQSLEATHCHNDWIEIGMHIGALGILAFSFFPWSWYQTLKTYQLSIWKQLWYALFLYWSSRIILLFLAKFPLCFWSSLLLQLACRKKIVVR